MEKIGKKIFDDERKRTKKKILKKNEARKDISKSRYQTEWKTE